MTLNPRESGKYVSENSKHVRISPDGIKRAAELISEGFTKQGFNLTSWKENELNPQEILIPSTIDWIFVVDTLNFSFWGEEGSHYKITFHGKEYTGYWSLCAAVNRALEEGIKITSPSFYCNVSLETLKHVFRSDDGVEIPLLSERHRILKESGNCLVEKFDSTFATCITQSKNKAQDLIRIVTDNFPSYQDVACIGGQKVSFYKRAQILVADIWSCFEGKGYGKFDDIDSLTIFADYRVPQALVYLGALSYSEELMKKLSDDSLLQNGDLYEVEIRGCTIWACELIHKYIKEKQNKGELPSDIFFNSILIDYFLWEYRRKYAKEMDHIPFHKVRCIFY